MRPVAETHGLVLENLEEDTELRPIRPDWKIVFDYIETVMKTVQDLAKEAKLFVHCLDRMGFNYPVVHGRCSLFHRLKMRRWEKKTLELGRHLRILA
jgi:hypothetical protein